MITISSCQITEKLHESASSLVFRGIRPTDNHFVILKILKQAYPPPERVAQFRREYEITRSLNVAGVVDAYSLESDSNRPVMVIEDFGGESLAKLKLAGGLALTGFLSLGIEIASILGEIHQRYIIHKNINPSNILFNPATQQVKVIDFGISTVLSRENPTFGNPNLLEGTLAYISPEQTGRMNRAIDYRTDFYSLGVTFYELLTGQLPFPAEDALELVHCHIAKVPAPPHNLKPDIPQTVSEIVLKLMAKNAEDRYQSARGLVADLEECLRQWLAKTQIDPFQLGLHDISDRFQIPQKLYGREKEVETLMAAIEQVSYGAREMMLVSGYSGIGKSALVQEVYKPLTKQRGYFITGKFDQFQRNIPYASLIQAFRSLAQQLLTETEAQIASWREKLQAALGANGQVIVEVIPEVELIIGPQPALPELGAAEAQNRFNLVFQNFIKVFTKPEHPLVLDKLLAKLINLVLENAGAQKGFLILSDSGNLTIKAAGSADSPAQVLQSTPALTAGLLPAAIINYVARTQENIVLNDASSEGIFTTDPYITANRLKSVLCAPILNQGKLTGILYLENNITIGAFTADRLEVVRILSSQAAISIENALLYRNLEQKVIERTAQLAAANREITLLNERLKAENMRMAAELEITRRLQRMILPKEEELHEIPSLDIAGFMEPADEVGGDYYDVLRSDGRVKIGIGDVTGHGLESGVLMLMVQTAVRTLLENSETDPKKFLDTVNRTIYNNVTRMNSDKNLSLALLDYSEGVQQLSGQHEEMIVVRAGGEVERIDTVDLGFPIGLEADIADFIAGTEVRLNPGDVAVLYTDGITEAENLEGVQYGLDRLIEAVRENCDKPAVGIKEAVIEDVRRHIGEQKVFDDITLVVLKQK